MYALGSLPVRARTAADPARGVEHRVARADAGPLHQPLAHLADQRREARVVARGPHRPCTLLEVRQCIDHAGSLAPPWTSRFARTGHLRRGRPWPGSATRWLSNVNSGWVGVGSEPPRRDECRLRTTSVISIGQEPIEMTLVVAGPLRTLSYPAAVDVRMPRRGSLESDT